MTTEKTKKFHGISAKQMTQIAGAELNSTKLTEYREWAVLRADQLKSKSVSRARKWEKLVAFIDARVSGKAVPSAAATHTFTKKPAGSKKSTKGKVDVNAILAATGMTREQLLIEISRGLVA